MNLQNLNKLTLIQICMHDGVELSLRYAAAKELQYRQIPEYDQAEIIRLSGKGMDFKEIAEELGISHMEVKRFIRAMHQRHKTNDNWKIGYKQTLKACGRNIS